jgi:predicted nucleic acid-binding protein
VNAQYVDTSAWAKLLVEETGSVELAEHVERARDQGVVFVSSRLLQVELHRFAARVGAGRRQVSDLVHQIALVTPAEPTFRTAGLLPGRDLRSLDALHIATALEVDAADFLSYDTRQLVAAADAGLRTLSPGTELR